MYIQLNIIIVNMSYLKIHFYSNGHCTYRSLSYARMIKRILIVWAELSTKKCCLKL